MNQQQLDIASLDYVSLMALVGEVNRPPGGLPGLMKLVSFWPRSMHRGIDIGCNTGAFTIELAEFSGAAVTGVDLSEVMIKAAQCRYSNLLWKPNVDFILGDATSLPYNTGELDFVFSGGSTAFVENRQEAVIEYARVIRQGGIVAELNFFYVKPPPLILQTKLSDVLGFNMPAWSDKDWLSLYHSIGLEEISVFSMPAQPANNISSEAYVRKLVTSSTLPENYHEEAFKRLRQVFDIFIENNEYLGVIGSVFRKPIFIGSPKLFS